LIAVLQNAILTLSCLLNHNCGTTAALYKFLWLKGTLSNCSNLLLNWTETEHIRYNV